MAARKIMLNIIAKYAKIQILLISVEHVLKESIYTMAQKFPILHPSSQEDYIQVLKEG